MGEAYLVINVDFILIIGLLIFSIAVSSVLFVYIFTKSRSGKVMMFFLSGQFLILLWTVLYIFEILAPTVEIRWIIVVIEYFALSYVGFAFLHFSYAYNKHQLMSKKLFYMTLITPTLAYLSVLTNKWHHVFYRDFFLTGEVFGPIAYLIIINTSTYLMIGAYFFMKKDKTRSASRQKQSTYFVVAISIPVIVHALHSLNVFDVGFTATLVVMPFSILLFIVSVLKYQFLDILPIAINDTIESMMDGMLVVHPSGEILDSNTLFFKKKLGMNHIRKLKTLTLFYQEISKYLMDCSEFNQLYSCIDKKMLEIVKGTITIKGLKQKAIIYYTAKPMFDYSDNKIATLITFFDMTEIYQLYNRLEEKNFELIEANIRLQNHTKIVHQLTVESERNKMMAEIHDTLGHSMMELLTLLEVTDLIMEQDGDNVLETVQEAIDKGRNSLDEVRNAVAKYKKMGGIV